MQEGTKQLTAGQVLNHTGEYLPFLLGIMTLHKKWAQEMGTGNGHRKWAQEMAQEFEQQASAFGVQGALIALDIGEKTIGVAACPPERTVATPVETIRRTKLTKDAARLSELCAERHVVGLIIGLPLNMDGTEGPRAQSTRAISRHLLRLLELPIAFWDERLSTVAMERALIDIDVSRAKRRDIIDESAATFILQGAIDRLRGMAASETL